MKWCNQVHNFGRQGWGNVAWDANDALSQHSSHPTDGPIATNAAACNNSRMCRRKKDTNRCEHQALGHTCRRRQQPNPTRPKPKASNTKLSSNRLRGGTSTGGVIPTLFSSQREEQST